jgi:hypothetical protein
LERATYRGKAEPGVSWVRNGKSDCCDSLTLPLLLLPLPLAATAIGTIGRVRLPILRVGERFVAVVMATTADDDVFDGGTRNCDMDGVPGVNGGGDLGAPDGNDDICDGDGDTARAFTRDIVGERDAGRGERATDPACCC